jgi:plasmid stability protein
MASLQIRQLPDEIYEALSYRAERAGRSLAQQAVAELRSIPDLDSRERRLRAVDRLREQLRRQDQPTVKVRPETWIREDRER